MDDWSHNHLLPESPLYPFTRVPAITPGIREEPFFRLLAACEAYSLTGESITCGTGNISTAGDSPHSGSITSRPCSA